MWDLLWGRDPTSLGADPPLLPAHTHLVAAVRLVSEVAQEEIASSLFVADDDEASAAVEQDGRHGAVVRQRCLTTLRLVTLMSKRQ